jgi:hypothetical protein
VLVERRKRFAIAFDDYRALRVPDLPMRLITRTARRLAEMSEGRWPSEVTPLTAAEDA